MTENELREVSRKWIVTFALYRIRTAHQNNRYGTSVYDNDEEGYVALPLSVLTRTLNYVSQKTDTVNGIIDYAVEQGLLLKKQRQYYNEERQQNEFLWAFKLTDKGEGVLKWVDRANLLVANSDLHIQNNYGTINIS